MQGEVSTLINAPAASVFALVTDITRIGEFSPETFEAEWLDSDQIPGAGARFRGHVKRNGRGPIYWTSCTVVAYEPNREFAFTVEVAGRAVNTWSYRLDARDSRTVLTESFALSRTVANRVYWALAGRRRARTNLRGMQQTLSRIKAAAEVGTDTSM
jgi:uncharacterized protein YndB with AHSA1/START domain